MKRREIPLKVIGGAVGSAVTSGPPTPVAPKPEAEQYLFTITGQIYEIISDKEWVCINRTHTMVDGEMKPVKPIPFERSYIDRMIDFKLLKKISGSEL